MLRKNFKCLLFSKDFRLKSKEIQFKIKKVERESLEEENGELQDETGGAAKDEGDFFAHLIDSKPETTNVFCHVCASDKEAALRRQKLAKLSKYLSQHDLPFMYEVPDEVRAQNVFIYNFANIQYRSLALYSQETTHKSVYKVLEIMLLTARATQSIIDHRGKFCKLSPEFVHIFADDSKKLIVRLHRVEEHELDQIQQQKINLLAPELIPHLEHGIISMHSNHLMRGSINPRASVMPLLNLTPQTPQNGNTHGEDKQPQGDNQHQEVQQMRKIDFRKVAAWQLGILLDYLLMGSQPFYAQQSLDKYKVIFEEDTQPYLFQLSNRGQFYYEDLQNLLMRSIVPNVSARISLDEFVSRLDKIFEAIHEKVQAGGAEAQYLLLPADSHGQDGTAHAKPYYTEEEIEEMALPKGERKKILELQIKMRAAYHQNNARNWDEAENMYQECLEYVQSEFKHRLNARNADILKIYHSVIDYCAFAFEQLQKYEQAIELYNKFINFDDKNMQMIEKRGHCFKQLALQIENAQSVDMKQQQLEFTMAAIVDLEDVIAYQTQRAELQDEVQHLQSECRKISKELQRRRKKGGALASFFHSDTEKQLQDKGFDENQKQEIARVIKLFSDYQDTLLFFDKGDELVQVADGNRLSGAKIFENDGTQYLANIFDTTSKENIRRAVAFAGLKHSKHLLRFKGVAWRFENFKIQSLMLYEKMHFSLGEFMKRHQWKIERRIAQTIIVDVLKGLLALHKQDFPLGNLTPHRIFLTENASVSKVAVILASGQEPEDVIIYRAPELYAVKSSQQKGKEQVPTLTTRSDVWSIGCLMLEILLGEQLYKRLEKKRGYWEQILSSKVDIVDTIFGATAETRQRVTEVIGAKLLKTIQKCLVYDESKRADCQSLLNDIMLEMINNA